MALVPRSAHASSTASPIRSAARATSAAVRGAGLSHSSGGKKLVEYACGTAFH
jgi:hypothetical protein